MLALPAHPALWRGRAPTPVAPATWASGHAELDRRLPGGGLPLGALTELCHPTAGIGELSFALPLWRRACAEQRIVVGVAPPYPLHAPALLAAGVDPARLLLLDPKDAEQAGWAAEQVLRSGACPVVTLWCDAQRPDRQLRRLQLAAEAGRAIGLLLRPLQALNRPSPAAVRLELAPGGRIRIHKCRHASLPDAHWLPLTRP